MAEGAKVYINGSLSNNRTFGAQATQLRTTFPRPLCT